MQRREFLKTGAAALAASQLPQFAVAADASVKVAMLRVIDNGLPKASKRQHILVIGAGMPGLVAAHELKRRGLVIHCDRHSK